MGAVRAARTGRFGCFVTPVRADATHPRSRARGRRPCRHAHHVASARVRARSRHRTRCWSSSPETPSSAPAAPDAVACDARRAAAAADAAHGPEEAARERACRAAVALVATAAVPAAEERPLPAVPAAALGCSLAATEHADPVPRRCVVPAAASPHPRREERRSTGDRRARSQASPHSHTDRVPEGRRREGCARELRCESAWSCAHRTRCLATRQCGHGESRDHITAGC